MTTYTNTEVPQAAGDEGVAQAVGVESLSDVDLEVSVEFGRTELCIKEILNWRPGRVVQLARGVDEPLELRVNGRLTGKGEIVVVNEKYGIRVTSVVDPDTI